MTAERKDERTPEQIALEKVQRLAVALTKEDGSVYIEAPEATIEICEDTQRIMLHLLETIPVIHGRKHTERHISTLSCYLRQREIASSIILTDIMETENATDSFPIIRYKKGEAKTQVGASFPLYSGESPTPKGMDVVESLPTFDQMPQKIDLAAAVGAICDVALEIVQDRQLTPERIAKLREVVYGQAIKEPSNQQQTHY